VFAEAARSFLGREKLSRTLRGMMQGDIRLLPRNKIPTVKAQPVTGLGVNRSRISRSLI
jgi:hypothetical protein